MNGEHVRKGSTPGVSVALSPVGAWRTQDLCGFRVHWAGRKASVVSLCGWLGKCGGVPDAGRLGSVLGGLKGHAAAIIEGPGWTLAFADKTRSIPVFYDKARTVVSNSARTVLELVGPFPVDPVSVMEFRMGSYTTGANTLYDGVRQIRAGEFVLWGAGREGVEFGRYYLFHDSGYWDLDDDGYVQALDEATHAIFSRMVEDLAGRRVVIPLSAGLDSRLVLCRLLSLGHDNIQTFSYGPKGNSDAKWARVLAERLGVDWTYVPYTHKRIRSFFWSRQRIEYWSFAGNCCSVPFTVDECALDHLLRKGVVGRDDVVVNGQSGDFISGGHIRGHHLGEMSADIRESPKIIIDAILRKHFNKHSLGDAAWPQAAVQRIIETIGLDPDSTYGRSELFKAYELWEWQERQSKYVINGQRSYDFVGLEWMLPLWDDEYMHFWAKVPYRLKVGQALYKDWLLKKNFMKMFKGFDPQMWNWQGWSFAAIPIARAARMLLGKGAGDNVYKAFAYYGRYANHYAPFGLRAHLRSLSQNVTPMGRYADLWLAENVQER